MKNVKAILGLLLLLLFARGAQATNAVYISQNGAGAQDGLACASAKPASYFNTSGNWSATPTGIQIGPDTTVHVCGTFTGTANTTMLTFQGSGTSGHIIILLAETGADFTAPYWSLNGAINLNGKSFITLDGNNTGRIENTQNGTNLANNAGSRAIYSAGGHDIVIKNWTIANICVHVKGNTGGCSTSGVRGDPITFSGGSNISVDHNTIHDGHWLIYGGFPGGATTTGWSVTNNTLYNMDHGVAIGDSNSSAVLNGMVISGNDLHDMVNWDCSLQTNPPPVCGDHHDYIHVFTANGSSTVNSLQIFNNYFHGDPGFSLTGFVNLENNTGNTYTNARVYNNVLNNSSAADIPSYGYFTYGGSGHAFYNNDINGSSTSQNVSNACFYNGGNASNVTLENNSCQNVGLFFNNISGGGLPLLSDYNDWFNGGGFYQGGFLNFSAWKTACSCDVHSFQTAPNVQTISPFTPNTGSPLIAAGTNLTSLAITPLNTDITGNPPSGAFGNGTARPGGVTAWDVGAAMTPGSAPAVPGAPGSLAASVSGSTVNLTWLAASGTVTGYTVKRGTASGGPYTTVATNITSLNYADTNLAGATYFYVVVAFNSSGSGANSNQATAVVQPQVSVPGAPPTLTASAAGSTVTLNWSASTGTPVNYIVKRGTVNGGPYTTIATLGLVLTYQDSGLANNTYYYVVAASNSAGTSGNSPQAQITVSTSPALTFLPSSAQSFGSVVVGVTATSCGTGSCIISVNNTGTANLVLAGSSAVTISGPNAGDFAIVGGGTTCANSTSMAPGGSCNVTVNFTPSATGLRQASLVIVSNDPSSPDTVSLSGTGVASVLVSPPSITFGGQNPHKTTNAVTVSFTNQSGVTLTFTSVAISGGDSSQFVLTNSGPSACTATLATGSSCSVTVTFAPTSLGSKASTLVFSFTGTSGSPQNVTLAGTGTKKNVLHVGNVINWPYEGITTIKAVLRPWKRENEIIDWL